MTNEVRNVPDLRFPGFENEWEESNIDNEFDFFNNKRKPIKENLRNKGEYPYYGATGIIDYVDDFIFDGNFILIGEDGANIVSRSAPLVYFATGKFWVNNHAHILYPKFGDIYFNYLLLENIDYEKYNTGTAQPKLNVQNLKKIKIKSPRDNSEQQKIGEFFSKLDRQIELEEQKLSLLEKQKKGYMQKIFSKELRFKDENGNNYPEWEEKNLKELIDVRDGTHESPKPSKDGYLLVTSKNLKNSKLDLSESYFISKEDYESINQRSKVEIGDILFGMIGTIGNPILLEECDFAIKNVALLKTNDLLEKYYILNFLKSSNISKQFYRMNAGGTQKFIALSTIRDLNIDMPSSEEAIKIGNFFNKVDNLIENQSNKLELLKKRKQGFLQKMFI
ncbi:restriction endonuclease subunit S [Staphylococcus shinii]